MPAQVLGSYRLVRPLGIGGMGQVFLAEHLVLGRRAAVKVLHPELSRETESLARFFNEARASASLHHPGLIDVYDFGRDDEGNAYIVMELLEGVCLRDLLTRHKQLPPALAVGVARQVAEAMSAAHAHGIIHRDLKPENLFLVPDAQIPLGWRAKVLDFGIAKLYGASMQNAVSTRTGNILGTPTYMAPEQCHGASHVDARCDIYSLGCILFEMLCGRPPFVSEGVGAVIAAHMFEPPPIPSSLVPELPAEVDEPLLSLLAKIPDDRPATMAEVATLLGALALADLREQPELLAWSNTLAVGTAQNELPGAARTPRGSVPPPLLAAASLPHPRTPLPVGPLLTSAAAPTVRTPRPSNTLDAAAAAVQPPSTVIAVGARRGHRRTVALVALGVLALASVSFLVLRGPVVAPTVRGVVSEPAPASAPVPVPAPAPVPVPAPPPAKLDEEPPAPAATVDVRITTQPAGALVTRERDGVVLGRTPLELHLGREAGHLAVALELAGYRTSRAELPLDADGNVLVELVERNHHRRSGSKPQTPAKPTTAAPVKDGAIDPYGN